MYLNCKFCYEDFHMYKHTLYMYNYIYFLLCILVLIFLILNFPFFPCSIISEYHTNIKTHIWLTVDFDEMRDACQEHTDLLMSLGDCTGHWDARVHFQEAVKEVQVCENGS